MTIREYLSPREYPGRGIIIGCTPTGRAAVAYFIMGRSASSRARRFERSGDDLVIKNIGGDPEHPELILYSPLRVLGGTTIVTNGDQTDTVYEALRLGGSFESALMTRAFEPDPPHYTSRVSGIVTEGGYALSILKAGDPEGRTCERQFFRYEPVPGEGRLIHTYRGTEDGVLKAFAGEPVRVEIPDGIDEFAGEVWNSLNSANRVALYVRVMDKNGAYEDRTVNKY